MKKYLPLLILGFLMLICLGAKFETVNTFPLFGKFIILDPGHGADDPGSTYKDEYEKDYNLDFAHTLKKTLEKYGATVILTRSGDYDLSNPKAPRRKRSDFNNRIALIEGDDPDIYLSLHMNFLNDSRYRGSQVFYSQVNPVNEHLAATLQEHLNSFFSFSKDYKKIGNDKYLFKNISVPGVLIEYGFLSNYKDRTNLKKESYRTELSEAIVSGLIDYFT